MPLFDVDGVVEDDHINSLSCHRSEGIERGHCNDEVTVDLYWDDDLEMWVLRIGGDDSTSFAHFWTYEEGLSAYERM